MSTEQFEENDVVAEETNPWEVELPEETDSEVGDTDPSDELTEDEDLEDLEDDDEDDDDDDPSDEDEEAQGKSAPKWIKELRVKHRQAQKEIQSLKAELSKQNASTANPVELKKPTLEQFDFDVNAYDEALEQYVDAKREAKLRQEREAKAQEEQRQAWEQSVTLYQNEKARLGKEDFDSVEKVLAKKLSPIRQSALIQLAKNKALLAYALGKNATELDRLAKIEDDAMFIWELSKIEDKIKTVRKSTANVEKTISVSSNATSKAHDKALDRLMKDAERTGDYSKVADYRRSKK